MAAQTWRPRPLAEPWTPDQSRVAARFPSTRRLAVSAANGIGKTHLAADLAATFLADLPAAEVLITAPTQHQVQDLLWPQLCRRLRILNWLDPEDPDPVRPRWRGGDGDAILGIATNTPQRLQGIHAPHLLAIIDEASGMPAKLIAALVGITTGTTNYMLAIGNPNECAGAFWDLCRNPAWSHEEISALTHPNILTRSEQIPGATSWPALCTAVRDWCRETQEAGPDTFELEISDADLSTEEQRRGSDPLDQTRSPRLFLPNDEFRVRFLGRFPAQPTDRLFPPDLIAAATDRQACAVGRRIAALDIARMGGDATIYGTRTGDTVTRLHEVPAGPLPEQARYVLRLLLEDLPEELIGDAAGIGAGLLDDLEELLPPCPIRRFLGNADPVSPQLAARYRNNRALAYSNLHAALVAHKPSFPDDPLLRGDLEAITYRHTPDRQLQILDKRQIAEQLGRSPDRADMVSMLWSVPDLAVTWTTRRLTRREVTTW